MPKIPQKFMGLIGKFADSLDYKDLPKGWADNPEIVQAAGELYRDMGTESPFFKAWSNYGSPYSVNDVDGFFIKANEPVRTFSDKIFKKWHGSGEKLKNDFPDKSIYEIFNDPSWQYSSTIPEDLFNMSFGDRINATSLMSSGFYGEKPQYHISVRHGNLPEEGISKNHAEDFLEKGLSVVNFLPNLIDNNGQILKTYYDLSFGKNTPKYLVGGYHAGEYGSDGEPLILLPQIIGETKNIGKIAKNKHNIGTFNPKSKNVYNALPFAVGGAGAASALAPGEASASVPAEQYSWPADEPGYVNREPGLGTPLVDVADLATAPIGAATAAGRAAAVAAEPFVAYGMEKAGNWVGDKVNGLLGLFGWGE